MSLSELQNYTFTAKYARWNGDRKRRETWSECVDRVKNMMLKKYSDKNIDNEIEWAYSLVKKKIVLGSQRAMQFGGEPIFKHNFRIYNCCASYCDRLRFFQECMYLLLCGCGTGFSVQKHHVAKLPKMVKSLNGTKKVYIEDSIEGWSDAIGALIASYYSNDIFPEYSGTKLTFDYSFIRKRGEPISGGGTAPGPDGLKASIAKIRTILDNCLNRDGILKPIECYDIVMHSSDAVLSGGVRRSATICLFSKDDEEMTKAKTGNWFYENPQRGRSNNSVVLVKSETSQEEFYKIMESVKEFGEPGFLLVDNEDMLVNPCCLPRWTNILTKDGLKKLNDINSNDEIWSKTGWTKVVKKWSTGVKKVYKYTTTAGIFYGTDDHKIVSNGQKIPAKDAEFIDIIRGPSVARQSIIPQFVMDGLIIGDGSSHKASNNLVHLNIGKNDSDYFISEVNDLIDGKCGISRHSYRVKTTILAEELGLTYNRSIPDRLMYSSPQEVLSLLRGIYSANGSVCGNRVTLKAASFKIIEQVQCLLSSVGIKSYWTKNKETDVAFGEKSYTCKESYDLNIGTYNDRKLFLENIGFIQQYKNEKLAASLSKPRKEKSTFEIISKELISEEEVFDIMVDNDSHTFWNQCCDVSNCEIGLYGYDENGNSGWQACNLSTINAAKATTKEEFFEACRAAAIIGTLQAGFTDAPYMGSVTEYLLKREALIGVSITGTMENPKVYLDPEIQRAGAKIVIETNKEFSKKIGINQAARTTTQKPEGSASCILGTSSGIHPHHARRYIRRVQANRDEPVYQYFRNINPLACEESVWSNNGTDDVICFCVEVPSGAITRNQISAIELLKAVKLTQDNWIKYGKNEDICVKKWITHNVSNTINVKPEEWEGVSKFLYDNRESFCGVSLLPVTGDKDFAQAPFTAIYTPQEMIKHYGDGLTFISGLIEKAMELWEDNLWKACDAITLGIDAKGKAKKDWVNRCKKFAEKYFAGDVKKLTYAMKDVSNYKLWLDLNSSYKKVDYSEMVEEKDNTSGIEEVACSGGKCEMK